MNSNFDRSLSREDVMRRRASLLQRLHIDGQLLLLLVILISGGLFVLYSASGKSWDLLFKQAASFGIGLVAMFIVAQFEPRFMARWVPVGYVLGCCCWWRWMSWATTPWAPRAGSTSPG